MIRVKEIGDAFADGIRAWWVPRINEVAEPAVLGVDAWLATNDYACLSYTAGQAASNGVASIKESLAISVASTDTLSHAFASEIARFSCAAYESLMDAAPPPAVSKSLGWSVVRHYYAAFYSAHAIMRIAGAALTYVSSDTAKRINSVAGAYLGAKPTLKAGIHLVRIDRSNSRQVSITRVSAGSGGSHEDMWMTFLEFSREAEAEIIRTLGRSSAGPAGAVQLLEDLRKIFKDAGWASKLRNGVNYRQEHGVWFPWSRKNRDAAKLASRMLLWQPEAAGGLEFSNSKDELLRLADVCNVLAHFMTAALKDIARRSRCRNGCFVDRRPFRYLNSRGILLKMGAH